MAQSHTVELYLGTTRTRLTNWDGYAITTDLFKAGAPWTFALWYSADQDSAWRRLRAEAQLGAPVVVEVDGAPQLNGRLEELTVKDSREGASLTLSGRDLAAPALDWQADPRTHVTGVALDDALTALFAPLGLNVVIGVDAAAATLVRSRGVRGGRGLTSQTTPRRNLVSRSHPRPGERVWEVAESIVRRLGYMMWVAPAPNGELAIVVDVPRYDQRPLWQLTARQRDGRTTADSNVLEAELRASIRDVPTVAYAFGRAPRGDAPPARHVAGVGNNRLNTYRDYLVGTDRLGSGSQLVVPTGTPDPSLPEFLSYDSARPPDLDQAGNVPGAIAATTAPAGGSTIRTVRRGFANAGLQGRGLVVDPLPPQPVYLTSARAHNPATSEREAARVLAERMAHWRTVTATVQGHGQTVDGTGRLYAVNTMAHVRHDQFDIDEDMLVYRVEMLGSRREGQITRLTLGTKDAIALEPAAT